MVVSCSAMQWAPATDDDAEALAELALDSRGAAAAEQVRSFLKSWRVQLAVENGVVVAAVASLPPTPGHHRGFGAWWSRGIDSDERFTEILDHLDRLAATIPDLEALQVNAPSDDALTRRRLKAAGFAIAYPLWTMTHDEKTPPAVRGLPSSLRMTPWAETDLHRFHLSYTAAYQDQRVVEPHSEDAWSRLVADESFAAELSRTVIDPNGAVIAFALAFSAGHGGVELGPIGTIPRWRGQGICSALLSTVISECHSRDITPITLTVDGESPTGAHRLYERLGFAKTEALVAWHRRIR